MSSPVADTLTIVQTIHKLYRKGYVVARNAPKDVRQVVDDLEMLGRLLYTLKRQMDRHGDSSFRQSYHGNLEDCLHRCNQAVNEFERLLQQFRTFNTSGATQIGLRLQWVTIQDDVSSFQSRISRLLTTLQLAVNMYNWRSDGDDKPVTGGANEFELPGDSPSRAPPSPDSVVFAELEPITKTRSTIETEVDIKTSARINERDSVIVQEELQLDPHRKTCQRYIDRRGCAALQTEVAKLEEKLSSEQLLYLSSWWLLKARTIYEWVEDLERFRQRPPDRTDLIAQCYTNLLKSSWILEEAVLPRKGPWSRRARKLIRDLCSALDKDFSKYIDARSAIARPDGTHDLLDRSVALLELRVIDDDTCKNDVLGAERWFAINPRDCGLRQREKVLYRTFVDAILDDGHMSDSTPYMLVLWAQEGDSEMFVSICDHHDTLNLCSQISFEDSEDLERRHNKAESVLSLNFSNIMADIQFSTPADCERFLSIPKRFFAAMQTRTARPDEVTILDTVVSKASFTLPFDNDSTSRDATRKIKGTSCSLRIYESTPKERWETTRRLVLSSWAGDAEPWCYSFWLPLSRVSVRQGGANQITLQWADFRRRERSERNRGSNYVYNPDNPQNTAELTLGSESDAVSLVNCILQLTESKGYVEKIYSIPLAAQNDDWIRVYDMYDEEDEVATYHAIVLSAWRGVGWSGTKLTLLGLRIPHYISKERQPVFEGLDPNARADLSACIATNELLIELLEKLTGWRLLLYHTVFEWTKKQMIPRRHRDVCLHVWERATAADPLTDPQKRLTARLADGESSSYYTWYCATLSPDVKRKMSNQCVTLKLNIQNGDYLHTDKMIAHNTKVISGVPTSVPALSMAWDLKVAFYTHEEQNNFWGATGFNDHLLRERTTSFSSDYTVPQVKPWVFKNGQIDRPGYPR